ncbi:unnamed protein product [Acanthoscelides obtectus]|uniref:Uncharacterized protein n=1 Tax=Acanthoscelides obtectus TaxID=200917 RepID=A0A9P0M036_ACAOB|nr:unnamed protein product [Acanthoscelides obtectus]CAK1643655.1 hypothetical protein AOBTE_LOCUS13622 [Acanthoscelides obtectus]
MFVRPLSADAHARLLAQPVLRVLLPGFRRTLHSDTHSHPVALLPNLFNHELRTRIFTKLNQLVFIFKVEALPLGLLSLSLFTLPVSLAVRIIAINPAEGAR